jgi:Cft2 family RNA processing exonuclease
MSRYIWTRRLGIHDGGKGIEVSCGVLDIMGDHGIQFRVVVDCGLSPRTDENGNKWTIPDLNLFFDGKKIDAVCITHVHGDHVGALPALVPFLAKHAKVFMSKTSRKMLGSVLEDGLQINRRRGTAAPYNAEQLRVILARVQELDKPGEFNIQSGLMAYAHPAGHIPGACSFTFRVGKANVHYSGDRCEHNQPGILGASPLPEEWSQNSYIACSDCTYGSEPASDQRNWQVEMDKGIEVARQAVLNGRPAIFFTFGVHRGGAVAQELQRHGLHELAPIYLDGSCRKLTAITNEPTNMWSDRERMLQVSEVLDIGRHGERVEIAHSGKPYIVIGTPGMGGPGGVMSFWRDYILPDPGAAAIFTGYVADGTDGRLIMDAVAKRKPGHGAEVKLMVEPMKGPAVERSIPVNCQVAQIRLGAHQSRQETIDWFRSMHPIAAMLNHGSKDSLDSMEQELSSDGFAIYRTDRDSHVEIEV